MWQDKNSSPDDGIEILSRPEPMTCGGTDAYRDTRAPKEIQSQDMILFDVSCSLKTIVEPEGTKGECIDYLAAFAMPVASGTLVSLETSRRFESPVFEWALLKESLFPNLTALVREHGLAAQNGFHSNTHGLPENFGGHVLIRFAGGEKISFSDNQSPILSPAVVRAIAAVFRTAMRGERVKLPAVDSIEAIRFAEERRDGEYTRAELTIHPDGTGTNRTSNRYEDGIQFENEKPVNADTVSAILQTVSTCGMFAWEGLPVETDFIGRTRSITLVLSDGREITVPDAQSRLPHLGSGFFTIELELTVKN